MSRRCSENVLKNFVELRPTSLLGKGFRLFLLHRGQNYNVLIVTTHSIYHKIFHPVKYQAQQNPGILRKCSRDHEVIGASYAKYRLEAKWQFICWRSYKKRLHQTSMCSLPKLQSVPTGRKMRRGANYVSRKPQIIIALSATIKIFQGK